MPLNTTETEYTPSDDERAMIDATQAELQSLNTQLSGIVQGIARARKLLGNWQWDGQKFVKQG